MNCNTAIEQLSPYVDGELQGLRRILLVRHMRSCVLCAERMEELQRLRARLRSELPRHRASAQLQARVQSLIASSSSAGAPNRPAPPRPAPRWPWLAGGAMAGSAATLAILLAFNVVVSRIAAQNVVSEAVAAHVQATLSQHLIEVASSDQHTVKPWFSARLDYSPPVQDLASEGFALLGGRLETLHGERVATLVYRHRLHMIDVFVRPLPAAAAKEPRSLRGFNVAHASGGGMDFLAVSDVNADVLGAFVARLAAGSSAR
jgi:anti-sigma factor RsiW